MKNGEIYRGLLLSAEDTMNMSLSEVLRTSRNGQITKIPSVYLRGSSIRFIALPDLLKNAPVFQTVTTMKRKMESEQQQRQQQGKEVKRLCVQKYNVRTKFQQFVLYYISAGKRKRGD
jgi:small nuclear ribonucleoprotein D3